MVLRLHYSIFAQHGQKDKPGRLKGKATGQEIILQGVTQVVSFAVACHLVQDWPIRNLELPREKNRIGGIGASVHESASVFV